jgi:hypothetical protein
MCIVRRRMSCKDLLGMLLSKCYIWGLEIIYVLKIVKVNAGVTCRV